MAEILIADMRRVQPREALGEQPDVGHWFVCPYSAKHFKGYMITVPNGISVPQVRLPLNASGPHEIYIGVYHGHTPFVQDATAGYAGARHFLRLRLSNDACFDTIESEYYSPIKDGFHPEKEFTLNEIMEVHWRDANLTGQALIFANASGEFASHTFASVAYVRLVPLKGDMWQQHQLESPRDDTKRLVATFDGTFYGNYPADEQAIRAYFEPMRDSDFQLVMWATSRLDACYYLSKVGTPLQALPEGYINRRYLLTHDFQTWVRRGIDPLAVAVKAAHDCNLQIYGSMRLQGIDMPPYHQFHDAVTFMTQHPEFWTVAEDGRRMPHVSIAFPEVRQLIMRLFREQVENYDLDGIHLLFNRSYPFVLFEEPVVRDFLAKFGEDPRRVDRMDQRLWGHRSSYVTMLMRELRAMLDEVGAKRRRRLAMAAHVMNSVRNCRYFGMDVGTWVKEGLVDHLIVHPCTSIEELGEKRVMPATIAEFARLTEGTGCRIYADLYPRRLPPEKIRQRVIEYYDAGADGISFWDTYARMWRKSEWSMIRIAGHREELRNWAKRASSFWRKVPIESICGISLDPRYGVQTHG